MNALLISILLNPGGEPGVKLGKWATYFFPLVGLFIACSVIFAIVIAIIKIFKN